MRPFGATSRARQVSIRSRLTCKWSRRAAEHDGAPLIATLGRPEKRSPVWHHESDSALP